MRRCAVLIDDEVICPTEALQDWDVLHKSLGGQPVVEHTLGSGCLEEDQSYIYSAEPTLEERMRARGQKFAIEAARLRQQRLAASSQAAARALAWAKDEAKRLKGFDPKAESRRQHEVACHLQRFLEEHKYLHVNHKRKGVFTYKYPLHTAVKKEDTYMIRVLLDANADPLLTNSYGETPFQLATRLLKHDPIWTSKVHRALCSERLKG